MLDAVGDHTKNATLMHLEVTQPLFHVGTINEAITIPTMLLTLEGKKGHRTRCPPLNHDRKEYHHEIHP